MSNTARQIRVLTDINPPFPWLLLLPILSRSTALLCLQQLAGVFKVCLARLTHFVLSLKLCQRVSTATIQYLNTTVSDQAVIAFNARRCALWAIFFNEEMGG